MPKKKAPDRASNALSAHRLNAEQTILGLPGGHLLRAQHPQLQDAIALATAGVEHRTLLACARQLRRAAIDMGRLLDSGFAEARVIACAEQFEESAATLAKAPKSRKTLLPR
jgi:hypothetical protein